MFVAIRAEDGKFGNQCIQEDGTDTSDGAAVRRLIGMANSKVYKVKSKGKRATKTQRRLIRKANGKAKKAKKAQKKAARQAAWQ